MGHFPQPSTIINQGYQAAALLMDSDMAILPSRTEGPLLKGAAGLFGWKLGTDVHLMKLETTRPSWLPFSENDLFWFGK